MVVIAKIFGKVAQEAEVATVAEDLGVDQVALSFSTVLGIEVLEHNHSFAFFRGPVIFRDHSELLRG